MNAQMLSADDARELALALRRLEHAGLLPEVLRDVQHAATEAWATGGAIVVVSSSGHPGRYPDNGPDIARTPGEDGLDEVLSQQAAADEMGVDVRTIRRYLDSGKLAPTIVDGRRGVRRADLAAVDQFRGGTL